MNDTALTLPTFDVFFASPDTTAEAGYLDGSYLHERVVILHADQLRAETTGPRLGLDSLRATPMGYTTLWVWCALVRTKGLEEVGPFDQWRPRVITMAEAAGEAAVDPTQ